MPFYSSVCPAPVAEQKTTQILTRLSCVSQFSKCFCSKHARHDVSCLLILAKCYYVCTWVIKNACLFKIHIKVYISVRKQRKYPLLWQ